MSSIIDNFENDRR